MEGTDRVVKRSTEASELYTGDQITVAVSHQIRVGRDESWVRYEAVTKIRPGEESDDARTRAIGHVNKSVMEAVAQVVETVRNHR
jgi:hypothetical protein